MKTPIVMVLGYSRAGKDTVADYLQPKLDGCKVKISQAMKNAIATIYGLPSAQCLEQEEYRKMTLREWTKLDLRGYDRTTFLDLMVGSFTHFRDLDPFIMFPLLDRTVRSSLEQGKVPIVTDCRTYDEADYFVRLGHPLHVIYVARTGLTPLKSDRDVDDITGELRRVAVRCDLIFNDKSVAELPDRLDPYVEFFNKCYKLTK